MNLWTHKYALLLRRELWEHKSLWIAPIAVGVALLVMTALGAVNMGHGDNVRIVIEDSQVPPAMMQAMFGRFAMLTAAALVGGVACIAIISYLLDCLYAERKDRSIHFWKSLPVGDAESVLAKAFVALALVPLLVLLTCAVVHPLMTAIAAIFHPRARGLIGIEALLGGYHQLGVLTLGWVFAALWYAPVAAWLMLASVLARRAPLMYAVVPVLAATVVEAMMFDSRHLSSLVGRRLFPWRSGDWVLADAPGPAGVGLGAPDWSALYSSMSLWSGLAAAAVMVYIVIRLRRYRDDT